MVYLKIKSSALVTVIVIILIGTTNNGFIATETFVQRGDFQVPASTPSCPEKVMSPADDVQSFNFTLDSWEFMIIESEYSASHIEEWFTYKVSFTVTGGSLEFFHCTSTMARQWELGGMIILDSDDHWPSTTGTTVRQTMNSYTSESFVFNHEGSGSRTVTGSIVVDTSPPSISCSLVNNATYNETVSISASATDTVSDIDSIWLYIDDEVVKESYSDSLSFEWDTTDYSNGNHTIVIDAMDDANYYDYIIYEVWVDNPGLDLSLAAFASIGIVALVGIPAVIFIWFKRRKVPTIPSSPTPI
jgi:hypothetical protein